MHTRIRLDPELLAKANDIATAMRDDQECAVQVLLKLARKYWGQFKYFRWHSGPDHREEKMEWNLNATAIWLSCCVETTFQNFHILQRHYKHPTRSCRNRRAFVNQVSRLLSFMKDVVADLLGKVEDIADPDLELQTHYAEFIATLALKATMPCVDNKAPKRIFGPDNRVHLLRPFTHPDAANWLHIHAKTMGNLSHLFNIARRQELAAARKLDPEI